MSKMYGEDSMSKAEKVIDVPAWAGNAKDYEMYVRRWANRIEIHLLAARLALDVEENSTAVAVLAAASMSVNRC